MGGVAKVRFRPSAKVANRPVADVWRVGFMSEADILDLRDRAGAALAEAWRLRRESAALTGPTLHPLLDRMHDAAAEWFSLVDPLGIRLAARALDRFNAAYPEIARLRGDPPRPVLYPGDGSLWTADGGYFANAPGRPVRRIEADPWAARRLADLLTGIDG